MAELLAPAGNLACALAAFDAGADAVYAGLKKFNARERTENFSPEELSKLLACTKKHGKKVYITFNTLIKEEELEEAYNFLYLLNELRPDALILQDPGVIELAKNNFPHLVLHGSTQMGIHNSAGLRTAGALGLSRVILERQTTLQEVEKILKEPIGDMEVELFIHGALCCCISGSCLFSSYLGGWSGNRGKCKQPCRRRYRSEEGNGFFLSAQDLCMIDHIPELMKLPIASFKIEGRLRRSDYVASTVGAYRMAMDAAKDPEEFARVLPQAKNLLAKSLGRKWSEGFYFPRSYSSLLKYDAMGVSGLLTGKVISCEKNGFLAETFRGLFPGDTIRIQPTTGDEGPAMELTKISRRDPKGKTIFIHSDKEIPPGGFIYKIAGKTADYSSRIEKMELSKPFLDLSLFLSRNKLSIAEKDGKLLWEKMLSLEEAKKKGSNANRIEEELKHIQHPSFQIGVVEVKEEGFPFLPASILKELRKEFALALGEDLKVETSPPAPLEKPLLSGREKEKRVLTILLPRGKKIKLSKEEEKILVISRMAQDEPAPHEELCLPFHLPEGLWQKEGKFLQKYLEKGGRLLRFPSLYCFALLEDVLKNMGKNAPEKEELFITTAMPLPLTNHLGAEKMAKLGASAVMISQELSREEAEKFAFSSPIMVEFTTHTRPLLLATRAHLPPKVETLTDLKNEKFLLKREGHLTMLFPETPVKVPLPAGIRREFRDYRFMTGKEEKSSSFNFEHTLA